MDFLDLRTTRWFLCNEKLKYKKKWLHLRNNFARSCVFPLGWLHVANRKLISCNRLTVKEVTENTEKGSRTPTWLKIIANLILMALAGVVLVWLTSMWLDVWTRHGKEAVVPSVKGLDLYTAEERLIEAGFDVALSDSIYDAQRKRGEVVDQNPKANSTVKEGCTIYLSINAFTPRQVLLPNLTDISYRQARSILDGLGIKNIQIDTVPSDFKDLVLAVKRDGHRLMSGARVPIDAKLVMEIGAGIPDEILNNEVDVDSMQIDTTYTVEKLNLF